MENQFFPWTAIWSVMVSNITSRCFQERQVVLETGSEDAPGAPERQMSKSQPLENFVWFILLTLPKQNSSFSGSGWVGLYFSAGVWLPFLVIDLNHSSIDLNQGQVSQMNTQQLEFSTPKTSAICCKKFHTLLSAFFLVVYKWMLLPLIEQILPALFFVDEHPTEYLTGWCSVMSKWDHSRSHFSDNLRSKGWPLWATRLACLSTGQQ